MFRSFLGDNNQFPLIYRMCLFSYLLWIIHLYNACTADSLFLNICNKYDDFLTYSLWIILLNSLLATVVCELCCLLFTALVMEKIKPQVLLFPLHLMGVYFIMPLLLVVRQTLKNCKRMLAWLLLFYRSFLSDKFVCFSAILLNIENFYM